MCHPGRGEFDKYIIDAQRTVEVADVENLAISWQELLA